MHCAVPLLDMIRYPQFLIARLWTDEYGDPDVAEEFAWLLGYSPYHHVVEGACYPAVLFTTAEGDSGSTRSTPARWRPRCRRPAPARTTTRSCCARRVRAGHGAGKPLHKQADELADVLSFFTWQLGIEAGT